VASYTHVGKDYGDTIRAAFGETADNLPTIEANEPKDDDAEVESDAA
jgi:hypothetical protein